MRLRLLYIVVALAIAAGFAAVPAGAQFVDAGAALPSLEAGDAAWGDYDNDGDLDLLLTGFDGGSTRITRIYRNDAGAFVDAGAGLTAVSSSTAAWGDYDNDGDLDLLVAGTTGAMVDATLYRNDAGVFVNVGAGLPGVRLGTVAWGDYDGDGDLDLVLMGFSGPPRISRVFENDAGSFTDVGANLLPLAAGDAAWGDYDDDGDLDLVLAGSDSSGTPTTRLYRNDGGVFADAGAGLPGVALSALAWGDFDEDGDLDLALAGFTGIGRSSFVYRNTGGVFTDVGAALVGVENGDLAWGDFDNDGDLDLALSGTTGTAPVSRVYRNDAGSFVDQSAGLQELENGSVAWGDYDGDDDLDLLVNGSASLVPSTRLYRNDAVTANTAPAVPANLSVSVQGLTATFSWSAAGDNETAAPGLTYGLRLGTAPNGVQRVAPPSDPATGYRRAPALGNAGHRTSRSIRLPPSRDFFWSVQAIDAAFAGSAFASEASFTFAPVLTSIQDVPDDQGGRVRLRFDATLLDDAANEDLPIAGYNVWRRLDDAGEGGVVGTRGVPRFDLAGLEARTWRGRTFASSSARGSGSTAATGTLPPGTWEVVGSFFAAGIPKYVTVAETVADSSAAGTAWSVFVISAHTTTPSIWFASDPDSGFSVDNLAPAAPTSFAVTGSGPDGDVELAWDAAPEGDFERFHLYRGTDPGFVPGPANRIAQLTATGYTDPQALQQGSPLHYKLTALDHAGNEGDPAQASTAVVEVETPAAPLRFALHAPAPNPLRERATLRFDLPISARATLRILDVRGRLVRTGFAGAPTPAGRHEWVWDRRDGRGARLGAGIYFACLEAHSFTATRPLVVLD